ncbi:MAG TPA: hypothetical protein VNQ77_12935 [Frankiaceae bacterium]|nr:hypothetical protein [Frankiaceae bacterium]
MSGAARVERGRRRMAAFVVLLFALLASGCAVLDAMRDTEAALEAEGFRGASVIWSSVEGVETITVSWSSSVETTEGAESEGLRAAGVIWRVAPVYFDLVETDPISSFETDFVGTRVFSRAQLESEFGPRAPGLDEDIGELANVRGYVIGFVVVLLLGAAVVAVIVVVLVRAARRRRAAAPQVAYPPPGSGWPTGPPQWSWPQQPGAAWPQNPPPPPPSPPPPAEGWPRQWPPSQGAPPPPAAPQALPPEYADPVAPPPDDPWRPPAL